MNADAVTLMQNANCAETMVQVVPKGLGLPVPLELVAASRLFGHGMGSGCLCGALAGAVLISGYLNSLRPHPLGKKLGLHLHDLFKETFGVTCCRALKAKRPLHLKLSRQPCIDLTSRFADLVLELWRPVFTD